MFNLIEIEAKNETEKLEKNIFCLSSLIESNEKSLLMEEINDKNELLKKINENKKLLKVKLEVYD